MGLARLARLRPARLRLAGALACCAAAIPQTAVARSATSRAFDLPAEPLAQALGRFSRATGVFVAADAALTRGRSSAPVRGRLEVREALDALLRGTGLRAVSDGGSGYVLTAPPAPARSAQRDAAGEAAAPREDIVIVGARAPRAVSEIASSIYVVEAERIQEKVRGGVPFKELLGQLVPSLDIGPQGRTNFGQNLRGRAAQVLIDGVSLNGSRGISRQFDAIDPFNIERIEVLSGASSLYGGGATGGILNIVTKRPAAGLGVSAQAGVRGDGHDSDAQWAIAIAGGSDAIRARLSAAWTQDGTFRDGDGAPILIDITQSDLQHNRSRDLNGTIDVDLAAAGTLRLFAQHYRSAMTGDRGAYLGPNLAGALGGRPDLLAVRSGFRSDVVPRTRRRMAIADYAAGDLLAGQDVAIQLFWRDEQSDFYPFPTVGAYTIGTTRRSAFLYGASQQNTAAYGVRSALTARLGPVRVSYGVDHAREHFDAAQTLFDVPAALASGGLVFDTIGRTGRYPDFRGSEIAGYAQAEWALTGRLTLTGGIRQQRNHVRIADVVAANEQALILAGIATAADAIPGGRNHYDAMLLNGGLVWRHAGRGQVYANYSEGFDLPDPVRYYGQGRYTLGAIGGRFVLGASTNVAALPLQAIKTRQIEAGLRGDGGTLRYTLAAFAAQSDRAIVIAPIDLSIDVVDQRVRTYGIEGEAAWRPADGLDIGLNGIWQRAEQRIAGTWQRQTVTLASPPKLVGYLGYGGDDAGIRLTGTKTFAIRDGGGDRLAGQFLTDLLSSWRTGGLRFTAGIQNLFDERYQTLWSQRAQILYRGLATPQTFDFAGRGRVVSLTAAVEL